MEWNGWNKKDSKRSKGPLEIVEVPKKIRTKSNGWLRCMRFEFGCPRVTIVGLGAEPLFSLRGDCTYNMYVYVCRGQKKETTCQAVRSGGRAESTLACMQGERVIIISNAMIHC